MNLFDAKSPCGDCPYRTDAPLQLWQKCEFDNLLETEKDTFGAIFRCHKEHGGVCVGWLMNQADRDFPSIALRLALTQNGIGRAYIEALSCPVPRYPTVEAMVGANYPDEDWSRHSPILETTMRLHFADEAARRQRRLEEVREELKHST